MATKVTKSRTSTKKATTGKSRNAPSADRGLMIAEAAYYLAEQRGFIGGDPMRDWLDAEDMIDHVLMGPKEKTKAE
jgi:Protein of unknown function (DUF2934)